MSVGGKGTGRVMVEGFKHTNISKFHIKLVVRCRAVFLFVSSVYYYYYYYYSSSLQLYIAIYCTESIDRYCSY